jgi:hypothetical protein
VTRGRTFEHIFTRGTPRDPRAWATFQAPPLPAWTIDYLALGKALGYLGKDIGPGIIEHARQMELKLPPQLDDPSAELTPQLIVEVIRDVAFHYFPPAGTRQRMRSALADSCAVSRDADRTAPRWTEG